MTRPAKRATSVDVARAAGVSQTTVSFVLNNKPGQTIPEETRRRVLEAAKRLDYRPHASARALAAGRSDIVLFSMPYLPISVSAGRFAEEFATALAGHGLTMVAHLAGVHGRSLADVCASVDASALVGLEEFAPDTVSALRRVGVAAVFSLGGGSAVPDRLIGRLQAEHLISRGHRRLGYALPGQRAPRRMATERLLGMEEACTDAGCAPPAALTVDLLTTDAARAVAEWQAQSVTAVAAYNDETALAVLAGARARNLTVPGELAVIGVDDIPTATLAVPPLTTIAFDLSHAARHAAEAVAAALRGGEAQQPELASRPHVVERDSA
ncbi:LacI family DNA-binding transcriptional regulator [Kitasatospora viridis]|uniref:LacI family transcriptional regulator n=1 Tax=Kitasatospora viridis TaxID=281105 RepID=A0A561TWH2_9ACTN|nr:LacI family DNA-binding transcriptional regulator [Kitasatospora viridis]TWF91452.1 LacI family transcriptional regulator [Kitasatospora viridis]